MSETGYDFLLQERKHCSSARSDNIVEFLKCSMSERELVRRDGSRVNLDSLQGKIVGLFFTSQSTVVTKDLVICRIRHLASAYNELSKSNKAQFEIVWIGKAPYSLFVEYLNMMPWLAIPYIDSMARNRLYNLAKIREPDLFLFNCEGKLFRKHAFYSLMIYGADWYPFTDIRMNQIADEDYAVGLNKSLNTLLANPTRNFAIANDGTKVPISTLEDKVVGIYFCDIIPGFTKKLVEVYSQLRNRYPFEVVMVHTRACCHEKSPNPYFKKLPWLSLPCGDSNSKRLLRMFDPQSEYKYCLTIVGQHGSFVNIFGYSAIMYFGIEAYPFSRSSIVEMEKKRLEQLNLSSLLTCGDKNYVIRTSGEEILVSNLSQKTILLLFTNPYWRGPELVEKLTKLYDDIKQKDENFEVILVACGYDGKDYHHPAPWLVLPHNDTRIHALRSALEMSDSAVAVFGHNGQLLSVMSKFDFYEKVTIAYPFSGKDLSMDVGRMLSMEYAWPEEYDDKHCSPGTLWTI